MHIRFTVFYIVVIIVEYLLSKQEEAISSINLIYNLFIRTADNYFPEQSFAAASEKSDFPANL